MKYYKKLRKIYERYRKFSEILETRLFTCDNGYTKVKHHTHRCPVFLQEKADDQVLPQNVHANFPRHRFGP